MTIQIGTNNVITAETNNDTVNKTSNNTTNEINNTTTNEISLPYAGANSSYAIIAILVALVFVSAMLLRKYKGMKGD